MRRHLAFLGLTLLLMAGCGLVPPSEDAVATEVARALEDAATQTASVPTVAPTYTPYPTYTPFPTATEMPSSTAEPTSTALPTPEPSATPEPATPTSRPTATIVPTATPVPKPRYAEPHGLIAFQVNSGNYENDLYLVNVDGSDLRLLVEDAGLPAFSPDGSEIMFYRWRGGGVDMMGLDGSSCRRIVHDTQGAHAHIGPDGYTVLYNTGEVNWERWQWDLKIAAIGLDGQGLRTITEGWQPAWHPTETRFVCKTCDGNTCGLFVMNLDGSGKRMVSSHADDQHPAWSPDGRRIAFASQRDGNWEIYVMNADGSGARRLTSNPTTDALPVWLNDGKHLVFKSDRGGVWALYVMREDGSDVRKIVDASTHPERWHWDRIAVQPGS